MLAPRKFLTPPHKHQQEFNRGSVTEEGGITIENGSRRGRFCLGELPGERGCGLDCGRKSTDESLCHDLTRRMGSRRRLAGCSSGIFLVGAGKKIPGGRNPPGEGVWTG